MNSPSHEQHVQDSPSISTKSRATPLATPTQTRQTKVQFANSSTYLSYELGQAVKALPSLYTRLLAGSISLAIFGTIGWAAVFELDDVADASGTIVPSESEKPITAMIEGQIKTITPRGQIVKEGDILLSLDTAPTQQKIKRTEKEIEQINKGIREIKSDSIQGREGEAKKIKADILLRKRNLASIDAQLKNMPLPYTSKLQMFRLERTERLQKEKDQNTTELKKLEEDLKGLNNRDFAGASGSTSNLGTLEQNKSQKEKEIEHLRQELENSTIKAPVAGRIYNLKVSKSQGYIQKGEQVLSISPSGKPLVMFAKIQPKDRDSIHSGMAVKVKLESDKLKKADLVSGKLIDIGANIIKPEEDEPPYFEATIKLDNSQKLQPGTRATAMIITGRRTILQKILAPIMNTAEDAATGL